MLKITLAEPSYLKKSIEVISELLSETTITVNEKGISLYDLDPANVCGVSYTLLSSAMTEFQFDKEKKNKKIPINLNSLKQVLKTAEESNIIILEEDEKENKLVVTIKGVTTRTFKLPIIEDEKKQDKKPEFKNLCFITLPSNMFEKEIKAHSIIAESVSFATNESKFVMLSEGDSSTVKTEINVSDEIKINTEKKEAVHAKYSIDYLQKIIKATSLFNEVTLSYKKDTPISISYLEKDKMALEFILAPRVDD